MVIKMPLVGGSCPLTGGKITGALSFWHHAQIHLKCILKCILRWSVIIVGLPIIFSYSWYLFHQCKNLGSDGF